MVAEIFGSGANSLILSDLRFSYAFDNANGFDGYYGNADDEGEDGGERLRLRQVGISVFFLSSSSLCDDKYDHSRRDGDRTQIHFLFQPSPGEGILWSLSGGFNDLALSWYCPKQEALEPQPPSAPRFSL